ncbi:DUF1212-domain-containing protein [Trichodelitschia bisporula]|uniref:DUF1212-domain-containing protein n=1 Tax=Trichodelitschia bisporula TaxID=703511 RepID=A0A6G1HSG0_9PEZI|nr:DUF1212-domain-containing protein [Trichodelitschia bisporula]
MTEGGSITEEYVPPPSTYRPGLLADLLTLRGKRERYAYGRSRDSSAEPSLTSTPPRSGASTPTGRGRFFRRRTREGLPYSGSVAQLIGSSSTLALPTLQSAEGFAEQAKRQRPKRPENRKRTSSAFTTALNRMYRGRNEDEVRITVHIAETIARQKYLVKLCQALMMYGAPTHRLEEYLKMSARVLEIEGQFLYIPGCMIIAFDDSSTHTTEVKLVKTTQGVDLGKLRDTHEIYKEVVHDMIGVEEATRRLNAVQRRKRKYPLWFIVFTYGLASAFVGPFAFEARLIDMPISFLLGILLGTLQHVLAPKSDLYANVFEISAAVMSSFLARAMGSIRNSHGEFIFCFSALAQSGITLILPGYAVLCASLELQSKSIIAGSVRMVYALIYSFFLGFGITVGTVVYGLMDHKASSETTCGNKIPTGYYILFVPGFTICLIIINRAKWKQAPIMMVIALSGYVVNFFASRHLHGNTQVINTLSALVIGIEANLYSRLGPRCDNYVSHKWARYVQPWLRPRLRPVRRFARHFARHTRRASGSESESEGSSSSSESPERPVRDKVGFGLAAAAMLPAIFVQVPSGLAVGGSLLSGLASADELVNGEGQTTVVSNARDATVMNGTAFNVGYSVIQVAIGITVGLFLSAWIVYPFGKKRSGLFSF